jgi:alkaline phosphatase
VAIQRSLSVVAVAALAAAGGWLLGRAGAGPALPGRLIRIESVPVGAGTEAGATTPLPALADRPVKNVVLILGDGMGLVQIAAAAIRDHGADGRFVFERFPVTGLFATHPAGALVTQSDAAATAMATGVKTANGRIGEGPDGRPLRTLLEAARDAGHPTGLATTSAIVDATPAGFAAHVDSRHDYPRIAAQMAAAHVDLLAGGGLELVAPDGLGRGPVAEAAARGVTIVTDAAAWRAADRLPVWAVFPGSTLGERPRHPDVGELAETSLRLLGEEAARRGRGFFLMIEEEGIDTAAHAREFERMARAVARLDRAVAAAARFAAADGATLVVVTGDHSTGGLEIDSTSTADRLRVAWASSRHGGEPVPAFVYGPPAAAAAFTGLHDDTDLHGLLERALGLAPGEQGADGPNGGTR